MRLPTFYLTKHDTELLKTLLTRMWECYGVLTIVLCFLFPNAVWFSSLAVVIIWAAFRLRRRYPRRHDKCAKKGILHGWFFRRQYYRTAPKFTPTDDIRPHDVLMGKQKIPVDERDLCCYECYCLECGEPFEVKPPMLKSFEHRPALFRQW